MEVKRKILVVDDSVTNNILVENILIEQGFEVIVETNGKDAIKELLKNPVDAILLDIMMPRMNGFEVLEQINKNESLKKIPVIVITAKIESKDVELALELGASDYIKKPIDIDELLSRVNIALKLKETADKLCNQEFFSSNLVNNYLNQLKTTYKDLLNTISGSTLNNNEKDKIYNTLYIQLNEANKLLSDNFEKLSLTNLKKESASFNQLLNSIITLQSLNIKAKKIKIETNFDKELQLNADFSILSILFFVIFDILIQNAKDNSKLTISSFSNDSNLIIKIYDSTSNYSFTDETINVFNNFKKTLKLNDIMFEFSENKIAGKEITFTF